MCARVRGLIYAYVMHPAAAAAVWAPLAKLYDDVLPLG